MIISSLFFFTVFHRRIPHRVMCLTQHCEKKSDYIKSCEKKANISNLVKKKSDYIKSCEKKKRLYHACEKKKRLYYKLVKKKATMSRTCAKKKRLFHRRFFFLTNSTQKSISPQKTGIPVRIFFHRNNLSVPNEGMTFPEKNKIRSYLPGRDKKM